MRTISTLCTDEDGGEARERTGEKERSALNDKREVPGMTVLGVFQ